MNTVSGAWGPLASMPSACAACTAGPMMSSSSRPNSPPSPACGFSPATAMRGRCRPMPVWAMRIVPSTASKVTASMAERSDWWMVTSTTRSSSLASIMRTGGATPSGAASAASACSSSVWPGNGTPAAASASLWMGAVTSAAASPACTHRTACSMQRAAAAPLRASTTPCGSAASAWGRPGGTSTGRQPGGTAARSAGASTTAVIGAPARRSTSRSPTTTASARAPARKAWTMVSGPMPAASPIVTSKGSAVTGFAGALMPGCRSR